MGGGHPARKERGNSRYSRKTRIAKRKIPRNAKNDSKMICRRTNDQQKQKRIKTTEERRIETQLRNVEPINSNIELIASFQGRARYEITNQRIMYRDLKEEFTQNQMKTIGFRQKMTSLKVLRQTDETSTSSLQDKIQHQMKIIKNLYQKLENLFETEQSDIEEQLQEAITTINRIIRSSQNPSALLQRISRELEKGSYEVKTLQGLYEELKNSFRTEQNGLEKLLQETVEMKELNNVLQDPVYLQPSEVRSTRDLHRDILEMVMSTEELRQEIHLIREQNNSLKDQLRNCQVQLRSCQKKVAKIIDDHTWTEKRIEAHSGAAIILEDDMNEKITILKSWISWLQQAAVVPANFSEMQNRMAGIQQIINAMHRMAEIEQRFSEMQNMMAKFNQRFEEPINYNGKLVWKIKNLFGQWKEGDGIQSIDSQPFYTSKYGYKMRLRMSFITAGDMGQGSYLKLSLALMNREDVGYQTPLPFRQKVSLRVFDLSRAGHHLDEDFDPDQVPYVFEAISPDTHLLSNVHISTSCDTLERRTYIEEDTIYVGVKVDTTDSEN